MKKNLGLWAVKAVSFSGLHRVQFFTVILILISVMHSAQEIHPVGKDKPDVTISVVGSAVIYSKDSAFNQQIRSNNTIKNYSKVITVGNSGELKIVAKNQKPSSADSLAVKKKRKQLLSSKKLPKQKEVYPKTGQVFYPQVNGSNSTSFSSGWIHRNSSFLSPTNDFQSLKFILQPSHYQASQPLFYLYRRAYAALSLPPAFDGSHSELSVRPPPFSI